MAILMVTVMGIAGCGGDSSKKATKEAIIGSPISEFEKKYGPSKSYGQWLFFKNGSIKVKPDKAGEARDITLELSEKVNPKDFLPDDAKEMQNSRSSKPPYGRYYFSATLDAKYKTFLEGYHYFVYEDKKINTYNIRGSYSYKENSNNVSSNQPAPKEESSSLFSSTKKVTCQELIQAIKFDNSHKNNNPYENKNVEITGQVTEKGVDASGKPFICIFYNYDGSGRFPVGNDFVVSLSGRTGNAYHALTDAIYITVKEPSILNKINKGNIVKVKGKLTELKLDNPRKANAYSTKDGVKFKEVPWGDRIVLIEADKLEF